MVNTPYTFITTASSITVYLNGEGLTADNSHPNYDKIVKSVKNGQKNSKSATKLAELFDTAQAVRSYLGDSIQISDTGVLTYEGTVIDNVLTKKILRMLEEKFDIEPMLNFLINLRDNPSYASQEELMLFMEANDMPITPDGCLLAYKSVRKDYMDSYSGTFDNSIGAICEMPRGQVNDNRTKTCSAGLHFAAKEYAGSFCSNGHLMVLKINPADVVSIPNDYQNQKGRCCKYEVIDEVPMATKGNDEYNTVAIHGYAATYDPYAEENTFDDTLDSYEAIYNPYKDEYRCPHCDVWVDPDETYCNECDNDYIIP